jgi:hypothetical protein
MPGFMGAARICDWRMSTELDVEMTPPDESFEDDDSLEEKHNVEQPTKRLLVLQSKKRTIHWRKKTTSNSRKAIQFLKTFCAISIGHTLQAIARLNKLRIGRSTPCTFVGSG